MANPHSNDSVVYAFLGNLFITFLKFIGFILSSSPSLFSETMHSLADTLNQGLLWFGIKRSKKKADKNFAYGYGAERFFWAVVSACGIFFLGAGVTIYHGFESLGHANTDISYFVYIILLASFLVESFTLHKAYVEIYREKTESFIENLKVADPVSVAVFYEDLVAVFGVFVASVGILASEYTGNSTFDAMGSILIGFLLALVAGVLLNTNRKYLLGKSIPEDLKDKIIEMLEADKHIDRVLDFKSEILDMEKYHIKCEIEFNGYALVEDIFKSEDMFEKYKDVKEDYDEFKKFVIYQTNQVPRIVGSVIDKLEKEIRRKFPRVIHIDLEIN